MRGGGGGGAVLGCSPTMPMLSVLLPLEAMI